MNEWNKAPTFPCFNDLYEKKDKIYWRWHDGQVDRASAKSFFPQDGWKKVCIASSLAMNAKDMKTLENLSHLPT